jgi:hypothetical protein
VGRDRTFEKKNEVCRREGSSFKNSRSQNVLKLSCRIYKKILVWHQWQKIKYIIYSLSSKISTSMHADTVLGALFLHKGFKTESVHTSLALELLRFGVTLPKSAITISSSEH